MMPHGYCECGCGGLAPIATTTNRQRGWVKGQPKRFIQYHGGHDARHQEPTRQVKRTRYAGKVSCLRCSQIFVSWDRRQNRLCAKCHGAAAMSGTEPVRGKVRGLRETGWT